MSQVELDQMKRLVKDRTARSIEIKRLMNLDTIREHLGLLDHLLGLGFALEVLIDKRNHGPGHQMLIFYWPLCLCNQRRLFSLSSFHYYYYPLSHILPTSAYGLPACSTATNRMHLEDSFILTYMEYYSYFYWVVSGSS